MWRLVVLRESSCDLGAQRRIGCQKGLPECPWGQHGVATGRPRVPHLSPGANRERDIAMDELVPGRFPLVCFMGSPIQEADWGHCSLRRRSPGEPLCSRFESIRLWQTIVRESKGEWMEI